MPPLKQLRHNALKHMTLRKTEDEGANNIVGVKSTGKIDPDSSFKIKSGGSFGGSFLIGPQTKLANGGSVLIGSQSKLANKESINPRIKNRNKKAMDDLVRIVF